MIKEGITKLRINNEIGVLEEISVTELGKIMVKIHLEEEGIFKNFVIGNINELFTENDIEVVKIE